MRFYLLSLSTFVARVFFVVKKNNLIKCDSDYHALRAAIAKSYYSLLLIEKPFKELFKAVLFSNIDLMSGHYQLSFKEKGITKSHCTNYRSFEYISLKFSIKNAPYKFFTLNEEVFKSLVSNFVIICLKIILHSLNKK